MLNLFESNKGLKNRLEIVYPNLRFVEKDLMKSFKDCVRNYARFKIKDIDNLDEKLDYLSNHFESPSFRISNIDGISIKFLEQNKDEFLGFVNPILYKECGLYKNDKEKNKVLTLYLLNSFKKISYYLRTSVISSNPLIRESFKKRFEKNIHIEKNKTIISDYFDSSDEIFLNFKKLTQEFIINNDGKSFKGSERDKWLKIKPEELDINIYQLRELINSDIEIDYKELLDILKIYYKVF